jgi:hypothetical protein
MQAGLYDIYVTAVNVFVKREANRPCGARSWAAR